jgi:uncharacterized membrane protein
MMKQQRLIKKMELKFSAHFIGLFLLTGYISSQLHELGHWLAAMFLNANIVLGFNRWEILFSPGEGSTMVILAAGPIMSLLLLLSGLPSSTVKGNHFSG